MNTQKLDFTKPITTRDGRKVRILCTDGPNEDFPIVGSVERSKNIFEWRADGSYDEWDRDSKLGCDLINPPIKRKVEFWVNVYSDTIISESAVCESREEADGRAAGSHRIACLHFTREYEEGEGL